MGALQLGPEDISDDDEDYSVSSSGLDQLSTETDSLDEGFSDLSSGDPPLLSASPVTM